MKTTTFHNNIWSDAQKMNLIDARVSLDYMFQSDKYKLFDSWKCVKYVAGLKNKIDVIRKQWVKLLGRYMLIYRDQCDSKTLIKWKFFDKIHKWAIQKDNFDEWIQKSLLKCKTDSIGSNIKYKDFKEICRFCLKTENELYSIFDCDHNLLSQITQLHISEFDDYPKSICSLCLNELQKCIKFRDNCRNSFEILKKIYEENQIIIEDDGYENYENDFSIKNGNAIDETNTGLKNEDFFNSQDLEFNDTQEDFIDDCEELDTDHNYSTKENQILTLEIVTLENTDETLDNNAVSESITDQHDDKSEIIRQAGQNFFSGALKTCNICGLVVKHLKPHLALHFTQNRFKCQYCSKLFKRTSNLYRHLQTHKHKFKCEYCEASYYKVSTLVIHKKKSHSNEIIDFRKISADVIKVSVQVDKEQVIENKIKEIEPNSFDSVGSADDLESGYQECKICNIKVKNLKPHMNIHTGEQIYKCGYCLKDFNRSSNLYRHLKLTHRHKYNCFTCDLNFTTRSEYLTHRKTHKLENEMNEELIDEDIAINSNIHSHQTKTTIELPSPVKKKPKITFKKSQCKICGMKIYHLRSHMLNHKRRVQKKFKCQYCLKLFTHSGNLFRHLIQNHEHKFKCKICNKIFPSASFLKYHIRNHSKDEIQENNIDELNYTDQVNIYDENYLENAEIDGDEENESNVTTPNNSGYARSATDKPKIKKIKFEQCKICGRVVKHLKAHIKIHSDERKYNCSYCDKNFYRLSNFKRHISTHEKSSVPRRPRKFDCDSCEKKFCSASDLKRHIRVHTGERPFICNYCDKTFAIEGNLHIHERIHNGVKPFKCEFCDLAFRHKQVLERHIKKSHENVEETMVISEMSLLPKS